MDKSYPHVDEVIHRYIQVIHRIRSILAQNASMRPVVFRFQNKCDQRVTPIYPQPTLLHLSPYWGSYPQIYPGYPQKIQKRLLDYFEKVHQNKTAALFGTAVSLSITLRQPLFNLLIDHLSNS